MDLWIRSQDKENLIKATGLRVLEKSVQMRGEVLGVLTIGTYKTEERALEVLDEIQNLIIAKNNMIYSKDVYESTMKELGDAKKIEQAIKALGVYEMPKE